VKGKKEFRGYLWVQLELQLSPPILEGRRLASNDRSSSQRCSPAYLLSLLEHNFKVCLSGGHRCTDLRGWARKGGFREVGVDEEEGREGNI